MSALDPQLWFQNSIPAASDLPGHLLPPHLLAKDLLPRGQLQGWSFDWFAGFPVYRFYFPLPGLLVAGFSQWLPEPLALRCVAAAPLVLLPWALWAFGRAAALGSALTAGLTVVGSSSVLMSSHWILGGNIRSVVTGEFSYAWSVLFLVIHLGLMASPSSRSRRDVLAGVFLAAALLSHVIPVIVAVLGTLPFLAVASARKRILLAWTTSGALTAFWFLPMASSLDSLASRGWRYSPAGRDVFPLELLLLLPAAVYGARRLRHRSAIRILVGLSLAALALAVLPQDYVMRGRPLPLWFLAVHMLAGAGMAAAASRALGDRGLARTGSIMLAVTFGGLWFFILAAREVNTGLWSNTMNGLPAQPGFADLEALVETLDTLPPGRVYWERGDELRAYGSEVAFALIPYWTHHTSLGGLLAESAPITEFLPLLDAHLVKNPPDLPYDRHIPSAEWKPVQALEELKLLGVQYLVTASDATGDTISSVVGPPLAAHGGLKLFDLGPIPMVEALDCWMSTPESVPFRGTSLEWMRTRQPRQGHLIRGPGAELGQSPTSGSSCPLGTGTPAVDQASVSLVDGEIRFRTDELGVPHLIRASYFPTWRASGARGPYLASPWFMVVVPEENEVTLEYHKGWAHRIGGWVTLVFVTGLLIGLFRQRRRSSKAPISPDAPTIPRS